MTEIKDDRAPDATEIEGLLLITVAEAAWRLSIHRGTYYRQYNSGIIGPLFVRLGGACRVNARELAEWTGAGCPPRSQWLAMRRT